MSDAPPLPSGMRPWPGEPPIAVDLRGNSKPQQHSLNRLEPVKIALSKAHADAFALASLHRAVAIEEASQESPYRKALDASSISGVTSFAPGANPSCAASSFHSRQEKAGIRCVPLPESSRENRNGVSTGPRSSWRTP